MSGTEKTIFAKIIDREIPAKIVWEDDRCLAFHDVAPQAPVHVLLVPKQPIDRIQNMTPADEPVIGHLLWAATQVAKQLGVEDAYRLVINNGSGAGQSVFHVHLHLLAGRAMAWPPG